MEQKKTPQEAYSKGDIVEFKVVKIFADYCEIRDEKTDINAYLQGTAKLVLFIGQTIKCRILAVAEKHPKIELVNISDFEQSKDNLTEEKLSEFLFQRNISWNTKDFIKILLTEEKEKTYESQCHTWIQNLLNKKIDLQGVRRDCSDLLELSDLLNICSDNERDFYQSRLTLLIEQLGYYIKAAELIENETSEDKELDTPEKFIDSIFTKLKTSGFVYHPIKNFNILSCLFLRKPELMNERIKVLLAIIYERDIKFWGKEPFNTALTKLLELYIRECDGKIDKTKDNEELIDNNMKSLALQLLLIGNTKDNSIANYCLNSARLCNLSSYIVQGKTDELIDAAFYYMFHSSAKLPYYRLDNVNYLPHLIANCQIHKIDTINSFTKGKNRLLINSDGIRLSASHDSINDLHPVFPKNLKLWNNLQIFLSSKTSINLNSVSPSNSITSYENTWKEIELEFFNVSKATNTTSTKKNKKHHRVGELVRITFTGQDEIDRNKYYCQIEDEIGGNGYIYIKDIIPYSIASTSLRHFYANDGSRYVFMATISDVEDDVFHFSMLEEIKDRISDFYTYDEDIICSVGSSPNSYGMAPAITKDGVSVSIEYASDFEGVDKNSIVSCRLMGTGSGTFHLQCQINDFVSYDFDLNSAFRSLMQKCSVGKIPENITQQEEQQIMESDKVLDESYVKEVIFLIDRKALVDKDYVKSYNYLGFARLLSLLIGWESQAAYYKGRMDIISMLHYFAKNSRIDGEELCKLENANAEIFSNNPVLKDRFLQLQAVSFIGKTEHNDELYKISKDNKSLANLASLVLAYNTVIYNKMESVANDIYNKIIQILKLKGYEIGLKYYGVESEEVEFKTSILFTSDGKSNQQEQMNEILRVINSFMNTNGGSLYIGVNDSGYGVGVEGDLMSYSGNKDEYKRSILDAIALCWGNNILTTYIESVEFDNDNTDKDVLVIKVRRNETGLPYEGKWFVRKGSSKRGHTEEEFNEYKRVGRVQNQTFTNNELSLDAETPLTNENTISTVSTPQFIKSKEDGIKTSRLRKNILADYFDFENFVEPISYFRFLGGSKFKKFTVYDHNEDESLLTLAIKEEEMNGYLILGYENGSIVKVPVEQLLDYKDGKNYTRNSDQKLIFASIASDEDAILTISNDNKSRSKVVMRLDSISNFEEDKLSSTGESPFNDGIIENVIAYDVIPGKYKNEFKKILDLKKTTAGSTNNAVTKGIVEKLNDWGITEI